MEFDELKKVWEKQSKKTMYTMDEQALENTILKKKKGAIKKANLMELFLIGANLIAGGVVLLSHIIKGSENFYALLMGGVMVITAFIILGFRSKRLASQPIYESSVYGDVAHGLSEARYVVRMTRIMQLYFLSIGVLILLAKGFDNWIQFLLLIGFIGFTLFISTWEYKWYVRKYDELKNLKKLLDEEEQ